MSKIILDKYKLFSLNTPEFEVEVETALVLDGRYSTLVNMVVDGWGVYPQVLNLMVAFGHYGDIDRLLTVVKYEKYPLEEMKLWLEAYFGESWKLYVKHYNFNRIAEAYFKITELVELGMRAPAADGYSSEWQQMAETQGMDVVKTTYMDLRNQLHQGSPREEFEKVAEIERFLLENKEYAYLYEKEAWKTLCSSLEGCKYIAEIKHYMYGLLNCLLEYYQNMSDEARKYCVDVLDKVSIDECNRERYKMWRVKHEF